jgi:TP901 family phage tail tape measure protein
VTRVAKSKILQAVVDIAGTINPSLGKAADQAVKVVDKIGLKNIAIGAAVSGAMVAVGKSVYSFAKESVQSAIQFESSMADVAKVVDGLKDDAGNTTAAYDEMSKAILDLSKEIPMAASEITEIVAAAGQSNIAADELIGFAESAAKMGIAFDTTAQQAGQWMAQWRTSLNLTQEGVETLADQINYLGNTSSEDTNKLSQIISEVGSLGQIAGLSGAEVAALGAATTGIDASVASTGLKNMVVAMSAGASATKKQSEVLESLGMSATDMADRMQTDAQGAIMDLLGAINQLPAAEQTAAIKNYFGKESLGTVAVLANNLQNVEDQFNKIGDAALYAGSMEGEFAARSSTTENSMTLLKNTVDALKIGVGQTLLPALADALKRIAPMIERISPIVSEMFSGVADMLELILPMVMDFAEQMLPLFMDLIVSILPVLLNLIKTLLPPLMQILEVILPPLVDLITTLMPILTEVISTILPPIVDLLAMAFEAIQPLLTLLMDLLDTVIMPIIQPLLDILMSFIEPVFDLLGPIFQMLEPIFNLLSPLLNALQPILSVLKPISDVIGFIVNLISKIVGWITGGLKWLFDLLFGGGAKEAADSAGSKMAGYAAGGFTKGLSFAGENGTEAVISFDPAYKRQNLSYWARAGQMLGIGDYNDLDLLSRSSGSVVYDLGGVSFSPQISVGGGANGDEILRALREYEPEFADFLLKTLQRREAGRYAGAYRAS